MSDDETGNEGDHQDGPARKRRARLNCAECRRLKLKCDRKVPCDNCIKRKCQHICPDGARDAVRKNAISRNQNSSKKPTPVPDSRSLTNGSGLNRQDTRRISMGSPLRSGQDQSSTLPSSSVTQPQLIPQQGQLSAGTGYLNVAPQSSVHSASVDTSLWTGFAGNFQQRSQPAGTSSFATSTSAPASSSRIPLPAASTNIFGNAPVDSGDEQSHGTLVISHTGRSKYLGPTAASEWLKDQEVEELHETPTVSRPTSPTPHTGQQSSQARTGTFNFLGSRNTPSISSLMLSLPNPDEAENLIDSYYRYFGWSYDIVPRKRLRDIFDKVYDVLTGGQLDRQSRRAHAQKLALLFIVLAMGALHNLELPPDDQSAEDYLALSRDALEAGDFMINNTMAGVQTLSIMAHFHLETEKGRNGDQAWPIWGLAMRIMQAMGLHRDGERWNLPQDLVEERRQVFWETHSAEIFQANCFSRPCSIPADFIDTKFPSKPLRLHGDQVDQDYGTLKFQLCQISKDILYLALTVNPSTALPSPDDMYRRITKFERDLPFPLRCRAALLALASVYSDPSQAISDSPEPNKRDLRRSFEQHHLALMISEAVINLYRSHFMRALNQDPGDPLRSQYGQPFLLVVERSNVIIHIVCELYSMFPSVTSRHWWCWYHAFNSAVNLGTLILMSPHNGLAPVALAAMDKVIGIYTSIIQSRASPRFVQNLQWLLRLRQRSVDRMNAPNTLASTPTTGPEAELDAGLLGWKTRFIERATKGPRALTISGKVPPTDQSPLQIDSVIQSLPQAVQDHVFGGDAGGPDPGTTSAQSNATDYFLHEFWDPLMLLQDDMAPDQGTSTNWNDFFAQIPDNPQ